MMGLDYADQRFFASTYGRFNTADPYGENRGGPGDPSDSLSWNMYSYTRGDPVNRLDPHGLADCGDTWVTDASLSGPCSVASGLGWGYWGAQIAATIAYWTNYAQQAQAAAAAQPLCPLVGVVGSYTVTHAWPVYAEFAPQMALDVDLAIATLNGEGVIPQINSGYRSIASQGNIPANNPNGVAAPGQSWHNVGDAVDIQLNPATQTGQEIIAAMTSAGLTWGGTWSSPDNVHFQLPGSKVSANGIVSSGAPSTLQVAACQSEHPLGH
jgi:RHS repeat-associated protein